MPLASDGQGNYLSLGSDGQWTPAPRARNPETGAELIYDGSAWRDMTSLTRERRGVLGEAGRQVGLAARTAAQGAASVLDMANNAGAAILNAPVVAYNAVTGSNVPEPFQYGTIRQGVDAAADAAGLARPETGLERAVGAAGEAIAGAGPLNLAARGARAVSPTIEALTIRTPAEAGINAAAGAGGQAAGEAAPEPLAPVAGLAGGLAAGGAPVLARAGVRAGVAEARRAIEPLTASGPERIAANRLHDAASDLGAVRERLAAGPVEIVPGSTPTTAQQTGDLGLLGLERGVATRNPEAFATRRAEQNMARVDALRELRGEGSPTAASALVRQQLDELNARTEQAVATARQQADDATLRLGGQGAPEDYGAQIRATAAEAEANARQVERNLWQSVDPDGTLALDVTPIRGAAQRIAGEQSPSAAPMTAREQQIFGVASSYDDVLPFQELVQLRSNVSSAMAEELASAGRTPSYARLAQFRSAVEDALVTAAERNAGRNASAYAPPAPGGLSLNAEAFPPGVAQPTPPAPGAAPSANFTPEAAQRLQQASAATRERADTFNRGPVGDVLRRGERSDLFRIPDAAVPGRLFVAGPRGAESIQAFRTAVGEDQALPVLREYAAMSLRRAAARPDGTIDPARLERWRRAHTDALREMPGLDRALSDVAQAEQAVAQAMESRAAQVKEFERSAAARLLGRDNPDEVVAAVGAMLTGGRDGIIRLRQLSNQIGDNQAARQGVRRAIVEHIQQRLIGNTEVGTSGQAGLRADQLQTFIKQNQAGLSLFLTPDQLRSMNAIALDLQQSARSQNAVRLPGGSNTAQDLNAASRLDEPSFLRGILAPALGALLGSGAGGIGAAVGASIGQVVASMRRAGLQRAEEILTEAMLDPALARMLLMKATPQNDARAAAGIARHLARAAAVGTQQGTP